jgi:hypothetical protein
MKTSHYIHNCYKRRSILNLNTQTHLKALSLECHPKVLIIVSSLQNPAMSSNNNQINIITLNNYIYLKVIFTQNLDGFYVKQRCFTSGKDKA